MSLQAISCLHPLAFQAVRVGGGSAGAVMDALMAANAIVIESEESSSSQLSFGCFREAINYAEQRARQLCIEADPQLLFERVSAHGTIRLMLAVRWSGECEQGLIHRSLIVCIPTP